MSISLLRVTSVRRCVQANAFTAPFSCVETRRVHRARRGAEGEACNALFEVVSMESDAAAAAAAAAAVAVPAAKASSEANSITCIIMRPLGLYLGSPRNIPPVSPIDNIGNVTGSYKTDR